MGKPNLVRDIFLALLPLLVGIVLSTVWHFVWEPVPLLNIIIDAGSLLALMMGIASLLLLVAVLVRHACGSTLDQALFESQQAQDDAHRRFLRRLDHEIKNPLTGIRAALANLPASSQGERSVQDIHHQVERLSRLVNDLRKLAELEEREIEHLPVDPAELLQEVVETVQANPIFDGRNLRLSISNVPWSLPTMMGDRDLLGLAFYNLVDNALKFTRPDDSIEVRGYEDGRTLIVEVADTGPGIPPDDLPRVFEELYRGSNARGSEGSGLGLSLVQRIIARHGGEVSIRSRSGQTPEGTVFAVRLPLA